MVRARPVCPESKQGRLECLFINYASWPCSGSSTALRAPVMFPLTVKGKRYSKLLLMITKMGCVLVRRGDPWGGVGKGRGGGGLHETERFCKQHQSRLQPWLHSLGLPSQPHVEFCICWLQCHNLAWWPITAIGAASDFHAKDSRQQRWSAWPVFKRQRPTSFWARPMTWGIINHPG